MWRGPLVIMGPTASGKSGLALALAERLGGEVITADSMQVYRGLDIGTAKPTAAERSLVPHHLVDVLDISEPLDVYSYTGMAWEKIREVLGRGRLPIVAGGSGLYIRALVYGLDPLPGDAALRARLEAEYAGEEGFSRLKALMSERDPEDYARWHSHHRKLLRAMEVFELTGGSITALQKLWPGAPRTPLTASWRLEWDRDELKARIRRRTAEMLRSGWVEEAERMIGRGLLTSPTARQAIGYAVIGEFLEGKISFGEMEERIAVSTWQYARRQITWFRHKHPEAESVPMPREAAELAETLRTSRP